MRYFVLSYGSINTDNSVNLALIVFVSALLYCRCNNLNDMVMVSK